MKNGPLDHTTISIPSLIVWRAHITKRKDGFHSLGCAIQRYAWGHRWRWCEAGLVVGIISTTDGTHFHDQKQTATCRIFVCPPSFYNASHKHFTAIFTGFFLANDYYWL